MPSFASQYPERFLKAFQTILEELAEENYFTEAAPGECPDGHPIGWDIDKIQRKLLVDGVQADWPIADEDYSEVETSEVAELVEAFYRLASEPVDSWYHSFCEGVHPSTYNARNGHYQYTVRLNKLLNPYRIPWRLRSGSIVEDGSRVLTPTLTEDLPVSGDERLQGLLHSAVELFRLGSDLQRIHALGHLADALERIKSANDHSNKKKSVEKLIATITDDDRLGFCMSEFLRLHTNIANQCHIRHFEHGKIELNEQPKMVEFLFYSYYNLIRFILVSKQEDSTRVQLKEIEHDGIRPIDR